MIDQQTIERIIDTARIQDVVSDYVTLRRRGANLIGLCPFHNEKTPSFSVSPAKGIFKCFGCGKGGNSVHFIMEHEQIGYVEALKYLAAKYHIEVVEKEMDAGELAMRNDRESMFLVNDYARKYFMQTLHEHIDGKSIGLSYFRERGFRDDIIKKFELGYSLEQRDSFSQSAINKGFKKEYLLKTGLSMENDYGQLSDRFRARVMFPVHSLSGKVVAFGGRILKKDDKMAKYVNSPESEIYHKSNELYGIFFAKKAIVQQDRCFLVEGYTDVISMHQNGIENVVASSGTSLTPGQIRMIHRFTDNVTVIYDGDPAGIKASLRGIDLLLEEGMNIKVLLLPDGDDPDSFARKHSADEFIEFVEASSSDFIRFKTRLLMADAGNDPVKRAALIGDIVRSISLIPNQVIRAEYVKECSTLLNVDEALLYFEINKVKANEAGKRREGSFAGSGDRALDGAYAGPGGGGGVADGAAAGSGAGVASLESGVAGGGSAVAGGTGGVGSGGFAAPGGSGAAYGPSRYENEERNLLLALIRYGRMDMQDPMERKQHPQVQLVADYIYEEINRDGLEMSVGIHQQILKEYEMRWQDEQFNAEKYFLYHKDEAVARLAADMLTEKYTLSKIHSKIKKIETEAERLHEVVPRLMYEYKNALLLELIRDGLSRLKQATETRDDAGAEEIARELNELNELKRQLAQHLGARIITRF
ncbi:MAG: DNA primase [Bacteroidales bacterium]|nr:DNA primase [Bacteroidales bacterium]